MKKSIVIILAAMLTIALTACDSKKDEKTLDITKSSLSYGAISKANKEKNDDSKK